MTSVSAAAFTQPLQSHMKGKGFSENGPYTFFFFRYSAVCNPYKFREKNMENMNSSFARVLFLIISASVAINIPRFLETTIKIREQKDSEKRNNSSSNFPLLDLEDFSYEYELTPLRTDPNYIR